MTELKKNLQEYAPPLVEYRSFFGSIRSSFMQRNPQRNNHG